MAIRHIRLAAHEPRCRPAHNDCGMQASCARKLAANLHGAPVADLSVDCKQVWMTLTCPHYISIDRAGQEADSKPVKEWIGGRL